MEYREAELREVVPSGVPDDDPARFLRELRQLRNGAGLEHVELAARAHYPCDAILAAEAGPALPDLPVLSAYVRGCGGTVTDWEERWRTLTRSPALTLLPTRDAGGSDAAAAGARIGSVSLAADAHDPAIIMAALGRVANGIAPEPAPARSLFTPASAAKVAASAPPVLEQASVFAAAPAASSAPAAAPAAGSAPAVSSKPRSLTPDPPDVAGTAAASGAARVPGGAGTQSRTPSVVKPVSTAGRAPNARRPVVSKPLIVAVVILVCLAAIIWALFS
ncbi:MAG: helix-turn-helix domain-containing protein [Trebonia sp.]|uniref:helix-turn-helix domain-containing protein n=1 Tax=Trebonia sp. TaxID=2767075 RepID=UPI003BAFA119